MKVLVLGGTGAMGVPLVRFLASDKNIEKIYVTSRTNRESSLDKLVYVKGNALDNEFCKNLIIDEKFDVIVDFMIYATDQFKERFKFYLNHTKHYIFISSSRVYAKSETPLTENSQRLLDVCKDMEYLKTDEYALKKAREENLLFNSGHKNFTIIRPYITCNYDRMQLGFFEKEHWLYRALKQKTIVFPTILKEKYTTLTFGDDLAKYLYQVVKKKQPAGETYHIAIGTCLKWIELLRIYVTTLKEVAGIEVKVCYTDNVSEIANIMGAYYQLYYDRIYDRKFDNQKICSYTGINSVTDIGEVVKECMEQFLKTGGREYQGIVWSLDGYFDKLSHEWEPLGNIGNMRQKIAYLFYRIMPYKMVEAIRKSLKNRM